MTRALSTNTEEPQCEGLSRSQCNRLRKQESRLFIAVEAGADLPSAGSSSRRLTRVLFWVRGLCGNVSAISHGALAQ